MTPNWIARDPSVIDVDPNVDVGFLAEIFDEADPRNAAAQIERNYGGGFIPFDGFQLDNPREGPARLYHAEDPTVHELARTYLPLTEETLILFQYSWVAIVQDNETYQICRMY